MSKVFIVFIVLLYISLIQGNDITVAQNDLSKYLDIQCRDLSNEVIKTQSEKEIVDLLLHHRKTLPEVTDEGTNQEEEECPVCNKRTYKQICKVKDSNNDIPAVNLMSLEQQRGKKKLNAGAIAGISVGSVFTGLLSLGIICVFVVVVMGVVVWVRNHRKEFFSIYDSKSKVFKSMIDGNNSPLLSEESSASEFETYSYDGDKQDKFDLELPESDANVTLESDFESDQYEDDS